VVVIEKFSTERTSPVLYTFFVKQEIGVRKLKSKQVV